MRLINADALIEYCNNQKVKTVSANDIARFPTIDAVPVKHGHWEEPEREGVMAWDKRAYAQCSVCKKKSYLGRSDKYCRYCGAKMDLEGLDDRRDQQGNAEK